MTVPAASTSAGLKTLLQSLPGVNTVLVSMPGQATVCNPVAAVTLISFVDVTGHSQMSTTFPPLTSPAATLTCTASACTGSNLTMGALFVDSPPFNVTTKAQSGLPSVVGFGSLQVVSGVTFNLPLNILDSEGQLVLSTSAGGMTTDLPRSLKLSLYQTAVSEQVCGEQVGECTRV